MVFISFGCSIDIFSFGKSFLICPLQAVQKSIIVRKVKTCVCEKYFSIVQIVTAFLSICRFGVALQYPLTVKGFAMWWHSVLRQFRFNTKVQWYNNRSALINQPPYSKSGASSID